MSTAPPAPPDTDAAAFVAALRRLKAWSGLSYRQLERRAADAGHTLPYSTAATMLGRNRLPREELVRAFVAACGLQGPVVEAWVDARSTIACRPARSPEARHPDSPPPIRNRRPGRSRCALLAAAALVAVLLGQAVAGNALTETQETRETHTSYVVDETGT